MKGALVCLKGSLLQVQDRACRTYLTRDCERVTHLRLSRAVLAIQLCDRAALHSACGRSSRVAECVALAYKTPRSLALSHLDRVQFECLQMSSKL